MRQESFFPNHLEQSRATWWETWSHTFSNYGHNELKDDQVVADNKVFPNLADVA